MPARFVNIDHDTPLLLPPDLRDWVPADHLVHFIVDAVGLLDLRAARVNHSGSGSEQYPPSRLLALLIYSYATGTFSSRKIERNTHEQVAVRLLCADHTGIGDKGIWTLRLGLNQGHKIGGISQICHGMKFVLMREEMKRAHLEMYPLNNLHTDPAEQTNLLDQHPEVAKELSALFNQYRQQGYSRRE